MHRSHRLYRFAVGVGYKDLEGSKLAMRKAVKMAADGEKIIAFHIPTMVPQQLLSSINEPNPSGSEAMQFFNVDFWKQTSKDLGTQLLTTVKQEGEDEIQKMGKKVELEIKTTVPSGNVKEEIIQFCRQHSINSLFIGPGVEGRGRMPEYLAQLAHGFSVVVVRDHCRRR